MEDISIYFQHISPFEENFNPESLGEYIQKYQGKFPIIQKGSIVIFDVPEYRNNKDYIPSTHSSSFREELYKLYKGVNWHAPIYDLGTIIPGKTIEDTFYALEKVCEEVIKAQAFPIIIGGSQELTKGVYNAYKNLEQIVNLTTIDSKLDIGNYEEKIHHEGWLSHILLEQPCHLFNFSNIGAQMHYTPNSSLQLFDNLYFDISRLGTINNNIELTEPYLRNSDILSIDLTSLRASELNNIYYNSPNGLFAHQICQIARYAGISDKLTSFGVFNYYKDKNSITEQIIAQVIWYFLEGYSHRKGDFPIGSKKEYKKFKVFLEDINEEIIFYKSNKSSRWWIEVPYPGQKEAKYLRHQMVPCSYKTYQETMNGDIPDLWWKTYQKLT